MARLDLSRRRLARDCDWLRLFRGELERLANMSMCRSRCDSCVFFSLGSGGFFSSFDAPQDFGRSGGFVFFSSSDAPLDFGRSGGFVFFSSVSAPPDLGRSVGIAFFSSTDVPLDLGRSGGFVFFSSADTPLDLGRDSGGCAGLPRGMGATRGAAEVRKKRRPGSMTGVGGLGGRRSFTRDTAWERDSGFCLGGGVQMAFAVNLVGSSVTDLTFASGFGLERVSVVELSLGFSDSDASLAVVLGFGPLETISAVRLSFSPLGASLTVVRDF